MHVSIFQCAQTYTLRDIELRREVEACRPPNKRATSVASAPESDRGIVTQSISWV
jgi:hypothetical protein